MTIAELFESLLPYLNTGIITLIVELSLARVGVRITRREYKSKPWNSLFWGLAIVLVSILLSQVIKTYLSGFAPFGAFLVLLIVYLALTQM